MNSFYGSHFLTIL